MVPIYFIGFLIYCRCILYVRNIMYHQIENYKHLLETLSNKNRLMFFIVSVFTTVSMMEYATSNVGLIIDYMVVTNPIVSALSSLDIWSIFDTSLVTFAVLCGFYMIKKEILETELNT